METVEAGGHRIAYERRGDGPAVVLVHGGVGDRRTWRLQLDSLADEFDVVAWDAPGFGGSSDPPERFPLSAFADSLAAFIGALGLERPHVVGLSFGGGLALELYRRHPAVPRSLVLAGAYAGWAGSLSPEVVEHRLQLFLRLSEREPEELVAELLPTLFAESVPRHLVADFAVALADFHPVGLRAAARAFAEADLRDVLASITVPVVLLYGDADQRAPLEVAHDLHAQIPDAKLVILEGVGHVSNIEAAERFDAELRVFLRAAEH